MPRYQVLDYPHNKLLLSSDDLQEICDYVGLASSSLQVGLSAGKGTYTRRNGKLPMRVVDTQRGQHKPGPKPLDYVILKYYPDADIGLSAPRAGEHKVTLDEVYAEAKRFYQPLATTTVDVKLASPTGLKAALLDKSCTSYRKEPVHYTRVPKLRWDEHLEANPSEAQRLVQNRQAYLQREGRLEEPTKKVVKVKK